MRITRAELDKYLAKLEPEVRQVFVWADDYSKGSSDTLSEEFQIAASIVEIFWQRCQDQHDVD